MTELRNNHRDERLAFQISPPWLGGYSEAAVVSREWKFISKNHYTLDHSIPCEDQSLLLRGPRTQASINNELLLVWKGRLEETARAWMGSGGLWRPGGGRAGSLHSCAGLPALVDSLPSPVKLAGTVDTVILATQQEKESLLFQL